MQKETLPLHIIIAFAALIIVDRYYWAQVAQWREDQSTNLWLGLISGIGNSPVGLMSSRGIPNPNGMILLGSLLSLLPGLLSVSCILSLAQAFLLLLVGWKVSSGSLQYFALASLPALSSVILRSSSVEFWNQYMITLINIFFIFWALRYLENQSLWNLPPIAALALLAPALYLAGIVNALVMVLIGSIDWTSLSPALSVRLRPGSMPLVFFGAVERAPARLLLRDLASGDPNGPEGRVSIWDDRNGNRQFEPGEKGPVVAWVGPGGSNSTIDPNLRPPEATQITAGVLLDRGGWRVSLTGVRRRELDLVESVNVGVPLPGYRVRLVPDPGVDYVGPQDDRLLPIFDRDPDTFGEDQYLLTNPDGHDMLHEGIELFV